MKTRAKSERLFDIELELEEGEGGCTAASDVLQQLLLLGHTTTSEGDDAGGPQAKLIQDAQEAHALALSPSGEVSLERFAQLLAMRGQHVWLRTGRLDCAEGQVALRHSFVLAGITATGPSSPSSDHNSSSNPADLSATQLFVVDPAFKEQFALPTSTAQYLNLFEQLPDLFVGTAEQLVPIVELMCTQMQQVFAETATSCPPWRTPSCMLTKWLPSAADDVPVTACNGGGGSSSSDGSGRSTRPSSSNTNSALSSPAVGSSASLRAGVGTTPPTVLAPIRTGPSGASGAGATPRQHAGTDGYAGLTPRSARSPLYFDQEQVFVRKGALLSPNSPEDVDLAAATTPTHYQQQQSVYSSPLPAAGAVGGTTATTPTAQQTLLMQWSSAQHNDTGMYVGLPAPDGGDVSCFLASGGGSWGLSGGAGATFGSTVSSPGCDAPWGLLRSCRSEDGSSGRAHMMMMPDAAPRTAAHGVAIVRRRPDSRVDDQGPSGNNGFAEALVAGRPVFAPPAWGDDCTTLDVSMPPCRSSVSASAATGARQAAAGGLGVGASRVGATATTPRSFAAGPVRNPTLDISRFDRNNSIDDVLPAGPLAWLAAERFGSTCSITSSAARKGVVGGGSGSSQHSGLSAGSGPTNHGVGGSAGVMCPPAVRRRGGSSTSSQCSALSAAIAGKGVPMR